MKRAQLEHIIRAACTIADDDELVIVGSQAVLGQFPDAPAELLVSMEADVYPRHHPDRADLIDGAIGELSMFHETFGYYADGVAPNTAVLPEGWEQRLVTIRGPGTAGNTGWALEIHDLVVSKYVAGRDKDRRFARGALSHGLASADTLLSRVGLTPADEATRTRIRESIEADRRG
jgi:hypothetical protein